MQFTRNSVRSRGFTLVELPAVSKRGRAAFTLVELLAVIAIIAILAGFVLSMSTYATNKAARGRAASDIDKIKSALEEYRLQYGTYYITDVLTQGAIPAFSNILKGYVQDVKFHDPWGNMYMYDFTTRYQYKLVSMGKDGVVDTADDINSSMGME